MGGLVKSGRSVEIALPLVGQSIALALVALIKSATQTKPLKTKRSARFVSG